MTDPLLRLLRDLPDAEPDRARADRVRARCHAVLKRNRRPPRANRGRRITETALACLGAIYLVETVRQALRLLGIA